MTQLLLTGAQQSKKPTLGSSAAVASQRLLARAAARPTGVLPACTAALRRASSSMAAVPAAVVDTASAVRCGTLTSTLATRCAAELLL